MNSQELRATDADYWRLRTYLWAAVPHMEVDEETPSPTLLPRTPGRRDSRLCKQNFPWAKVRGLVRKMGPSVKGIGQSS